jgi:hypothetical protein
MPPRGQLRRGARVEHGAVPELPPTRGANRGD